MPTRSLPGEGVVREVHRPVAALGERLVDGARRRRGPHEDDRDLGVPARLLQANGLLDGVAVVRVDRVLARADETAGARVDPLLGGRIRHLLHADGDLHAPEDSHGSEADGAGRRRRAIGACAIGASVGEGAVARHRAPIGPRGAASAPSGATHLRRSATCGGQYVRIACADATVLGAAAGSFERVTDRRVVRSLLHGRRDTARILRASAPAARAAPLPCSATWQSTARTGAAAGARP